MSASPTMTTYRTPTGETKELMLYTGRQLSGRREAFAKLVAFGALPGDAVAEAYGKPNETPEDRKQRRADGLHLLLDTDIRIRVQELRRPIQRKLARKWEYTLDKALEDCQAAWDVAYSDGNSSMMLKCIELRAKLTKILTDEVNVTHKYGALDVETTEVLVALKDALKRKKSQIKIIEGDSRGGAADRVGGPPNTPLLAGG